MGSVTDETVFTGTITFLQCYSAQPWPDIHTIIHTVDVNGGSVRVWIGPDRRINAVFKPNESNAFYAQSVPIEFIDESWEMIVSIRWHRDNGDIFINGQMAGSSEPNSSVVEVIRIAQPQYLEKYKEKLPDRSPHIDEYVNRRKTEVAERKQMKERRPVTSEEHQRRLQDAASQLRHIEILIENGHNYFETALADRIRALLCRFKRGPSYPLLQHVAGMKGIPLLVYGMPFSGTNTDHSLSEGLKGWLLGPIALQRTNPLLIEMDLDEWLEMKQANVEKKDYTNNDLLRAIADTCGTHYDSSVPPILDFLQINLAGPGGKSMMIHKLLEISRVSVSLCDIVLDAERADT